MTDNSLRTRSLSPVAIQYGNPKLIERSIPNFESPIVSTAKLETREEMRAKITQFYSNKEQAYLEDKDSYNIVRNKIYPDFNTIKHSESPFEDGQI